MTQSDLIAQAGHRDRNLVRREVEIIGEHAFEGMMDTLARGDHVEIREFGGCTVTHREREARTGRRPKTGQPVEIAARRVLPFKTGKQLLEMLNEKQVLKTFCIPPGDVILLAHVSRHLPNSDKPTEQRSQEVSFHGKGNRSRQVVQR